jgi:ribosomal protein L12E/L44/L45/RPP1/RPP2
MSTDTERRLAEFIELRAELVALKCRVASLVARMNDHPVDEGLAEIEGMSAAATAAALEKIEDVNPSLAARLDRRPVLTE